MNTFSVIYVEDNKVDEKLNSKLIKALSLCFPDQPIFNKQRFFKELPQHRWYIEEKDVIIAHVAVHEKVIFTDQGAIKIAGIAEVFVDPNYRKKGLAKLVLDSAHSWAKSKEYEFTMLYGDKNVYGSSGYVIITNKIKYLDHVTNEWKTEVSPDAMIKHLTNSLWPKGIIDINGPTF